MRHASGHNYRNSSFIVDVAVGQIPRSTERISSFTIIFAVLLHDLASAYQISPKRNHSRQIYDVISISNSNF